MLGSNCRSRTAATYRRQHDNKSADGSSYKSDDGDEIDAKYSEQSFENDSEESSDIASIDERQSHTDTDNLEESGDNLSRSESDIDFSESSDLSNLKSDTDCSQSDIDRSDTEDLEYLRTSGKPGFLPHTPLRDQTTPSAITPLQRGSLATMQWSPLVGTLAPSPLFRRGSNVIHSRSVHTLPFNTDLFNNQRPVNAKLFQNQRPLSMTAMEETTSNGTHHHPSTPSPCRRSVFKTYFEQHHQQACSRCQAQTGTQSVECDDTPMQACMTPDRLADRLQNSVWVQSSPMAWSPLQQQ
jgi:hypothetical protein